MGKACANTEKTLLNTTYVREGVKHNLKYAEV